MAPSIGPPSQRTKDDRAQLVEEKCRIDEQLAVANLSVCCVASDPRPASGHIHAPPLRKGCIRRESTSGAALEAVRRAVGGAEAVGGGYCRLQMPLRPALGVRGTVAGHRLGPLEGGGVPTPLVLHPRPPPPIQRPGGRPPRCRAAMARAAHRSRALKRSSTRTMACNTFTRYAPVRATRSRPCLHGGPTDKRSLDRPPRPRARRRGDPDGAAGA